MGGKKPKQNRFPEWQLKWEILYKNWKMLSLRLSSPLRNTILFSLSSTLKRAKWKKKTYSNRWEQKMFLSFYLLSCLAVFSLQPHKHWSFWREYLHEFTARKLNHKGIKQDPRSPRRPVKGRNQELSRVYNMWFHHINILPIPNFIPSAYANISLLLNWHIKNGKGFCSGTQRMNLLPRCS